MASKKKDKRAGSLEQVRNIGVIAHVDAGKTTTTERMIYYAGRSHTMGNVDDGNTTTDWDEEEAARGITIYSATTQVDWLDCQINIIDTPGHVDFTAEVQRSLRVLDGAVVVFDGVAGVQAQSETVWRQADRYGVARLCFVNKLDKVGANFQGAVDSIEERLESNPLPIQIPIGIESDVEGVIDLVTMEAVRFAGELGDEVVRGEIPEGSKADAVAYREQLIERLVDHHEPLMEAVLEDQPVTEELLHAALRAATLAGAVQPVLTGSAKNRMGVQPLLDAVCRYLPAPTDMPPTRATRVGGKTDGEEVELPHDPSADPVVLAFKTRSDEHGEVTFLRVYSGTIKNGMQVYNPRAGRVERITNLMILHGDKPQKLDEVGAGGIAAMRGLRYTNTGDTLCLKREQVQLEAMTFPETVVAMSIEPRSSGDKKKLDDVLARLAKDDPTFRTYIDKDTGQMIVAGMGELHLDVIKKRMLRDFRVDCVVGKPRVSYKETIREAATQEVVVDRTVGEERVYAKVKVSVEPSRFVPEVAVVDRLSSEDPLPEAYRAAVLEAAAGASSGILEGHPLIRVKVAVLAAEAQDMEGSELAFSEATSKALDRALEAAGGVKLEPIMKLQVEVPGDSLGDVLGDLNARRATISDTAQVGSEALVTATVPIKEMFGYASHFRSLTGGRGSWSMEPHDFAEVPPGA